MTGAPKDFAPTARLFGNRLQRFAKQISSMPREIANRGSSGEGRIDDFVNNAMNVR